MRYTDDSALPQLSEDEFMAELARARPYTLCILKAGPRFEAPDPGWTSPVARIIWQHGKRNMALYKSGLMRIVCPVADGSGVCGVCIFDASLEDVERIMREDPGVKAGVFTYDIHATQSFPDSSLSDG